MKEARHMRINPSGNLPPIVITGFMGTGKTETAREISKLLAIEFIDTDALVEKLAGCSIPEIIAENGEPYFRSLEAEACKRLYGKRGAVIATGGGALLNEKAFEAFASTGTIVLLETSADILAKRLSGDETRPLLSSGGAVLTGNKLLKKIRSLQKEREKTYKKIPFKIDTSLIPPQAAACRIVSRIDIPSAVYSLRLRGYPPPGPHSLNNRYRLRNTGGTPCSNGHTASCKSDPKRFGPVIEVGRGILSKIGERLKARGLAEDVILIMPEITRKHFLTQIETSLDLERIPRRVIAVRDDESDKTLDQAGRILDKLAEFGASRDSVIIPVGGGVTGDIGGFAAAVYMRGIRFVHVPTTLLAQVDSSIGGKTGVDHPMGKNLFGCFHQPDLVLTDPCVLRTLPLEQISNGMAEVIKTALLGSPQLFEFIETKLAVVGEDALRDTDFLDRCVAECAAIKGAIVEDDPFENDKRRSLNLGHTAGHALEAAGGYTMSHGWAVALGLAAALEISISRGMAKRSLLERTVSILKRCRLPVTVPPFDEEAFLRSLHLDKKRTQKRIHFVLPAGACGVKIVDDVTPEEIISAVTKGMK